MTEPEKQAPTDPVRINGKFAPGHSGNPAGRPRGWDFRRLVAEARGEDVPKGLVRVFAALLERAEMGDVQAAKLLLDRLCDSDPTEVEVRGISDMDAAKQIAALLAVAAARAKAKVEE